MFRKKNVLNLMLFAILMLSFTSKVILGQALSSEKKISLSKFSEFKSNSNLPLQNKIFAQLKTKLSTSGFLVKEGIGQDLNARLNSAKKDGASFHIEGFFKRDANDNLSIYIQIYNPETGFVIDAVNQSYDYSELEGITLNKEEMKVSDDSVLASVEKKLDTRLRTNPNRKERRENIDESILSTPLAELNLPIAPEDAEKATEEVFKLLNEEESISIVSKRVGQEESAERTSAIVSVLGRKKIQDSGARNLADILKQLPGVEIFYDQFGFYKVSFRGIRSKSGILLLLDGHRMNNFYDGSTFLDIRADAIEKVEVIRGPGSSVHGTNALVGVINVVTRDLGQGKDSEVNLTIRRGSFDTTEPSGFFGKKIGNSNWRMTAYGSGYQSERPKFHVRYDETCAMTPPSGGSIFFGTTGCNRYAPPLYLSPYIRTNDQKRQSNLFLKMQDGKDGVYLSGKYLKEVRGPHLGELNQVTPDSELSFEFLNANLGIGRFAITEKLSVNGRVYGDKYIRRDDIQVARPDAIAHQFMSARKRISYNYQTIGGEAILQYNPSSRLVLMLGGQYERLNVNNFYIQQNYGTVGGAITGLQPIFWDYDYTEKDQNKERTIQGLFFQTIYDPFKWMSITFGVRQDFYSDFGKTINPKGGIVFVPFEKTPNGSLSFKILAGSAFRAPTFQELYDRTQQFQIGGYFGNNQLQPETIQTAEIGLEYNTPYTPLTVLGNAFFNKIRNNIDGFNVSGTIPGSSDKYLNLRGITTQGFEVELRLNYSTRNYMFTNVSWLQSVDYGGLPPNENIDTKTFLLDVPQARGNIGLHHELTKYFNVNHTIWASSERGSNSRYPFEAADNRSFRLPQYHIYNLSIATTEDLWKNLVLRFSIFNLNNFKLYEDSNFAASSFYPNRVFPSPHIWGRYFEIRASYQLQ
jgi:outer membrane receptor protein involved in Fe transport